MAISVSWPTTRPEPSSWARTFADGRYAFTGLATGPATVLVDTGTVPERLTAPVPLLSQRVELLDDQEAQLRPLPMTMVVVPREIQAANLRAAGYLLSIDTVSQLVDIATGDILREITGEDPWLTSIEQEVIRLANEAQNENGGILSEDVLDVKLAYRQRTVFVPLPHAEPVVMQQVSTVVDRGRHRVPAGQQIGGRGGHPATQGTRKPRPWNS